MINLIPYPQSVSVTGHYQKYDISEISFVHDKNIKKEGYSIIASNGNVIVKYCDEAGKYYALLTLKQLENNGEIPQCEIKDYPRFSYRAFMLDSSRHFLPFEDVKRFIRSAALFKLNYFHWHLSDDQGFRFESEVFPFLNKVGSYRERIGFGSKEEGIYGGYYTKKEIKEIIELCSSLHIEVIPEIDIPGHTMSLIASYAALGCSKDNLSVPFQNGVKEDVLCAGREETYDFCFKLLDEVAELFPCEFFHIGGDEVPKKNWKKCPDCQAKIKAEKLKNEEELQGYFTKRVSDHLKSIGKTPIVWNDALNSGMIGNDVVVSNWWDSTHKVGPFINSGGRVISEQTSHNYLDYSFSMLPLKKCYDYDVLPGGAKESAISNILGIEAPLWSEWIPDFNRLSYQAYPRLMAVAENAWTERDNKKYERFLKNIDSYLPLLKQFGIAYAPKDHWDPSLSVKAKLDLEWKKHFSND